MARPLDTSEDVRRMQIDGLRAMSPARRIELAIEMSELAAQISRAGAQRRQTLRDDA